MKKIFFWILIAASMSCSQEKDIISTFTHRGGYIIFENSEISTNKNNLDKLEENSVIIEENIVDPNNNAISYALTLFFDDDNSNLTPDVRVPNIATVNSFPGTVKIILKDVLDALNLTQADINEETLFYFEAAVTTPEGTYTRTLPDLSDLDEVPLYNEFSTDLNLLNPTALNGVLHAMSFSVTFFIPPPNKIRGTSFEEPFPAQEPGDDYIRPDGQGDDQEGELFNNEFQRHVMHVARGTGIDDEIGFRSFYFSNGSIGFDKREIGVTRKNIDVLEYLDGEQGFQIESVYGRYRLQFDKVDVPADITSSGVQISLFFRDTNYESNDRLHAFVEVERAGGVTETIVVADFDGLVMNERKLKWFQIDTGFLEGILSYQLTIDTEINSFVEEVYFDRMVVYQPQPE